jgi:hypothetical protein
MKTILNKAFIALAITAIAALGADNSMGTWKLNVEKSTYTPAPMPIKSLTTVREAGNGGVKVTTTGEQADGTPINSTASVKYDGHDYPFTGAPWDSMSIKQIDANTFAAESKQSNGKYHATGKTVVAQDGKTMTTTTKGTNAAGVPFTAVFVYDKQ